MRNFGTLDLYLDYCTTVNIKPAFSFFLFASHVQATVYYSQRPLARNNRCKKLRLRFWLVVLRNSVEAGIFYDVY